MKPSSWLLLAATVAATATAAEKPQSVPPERLANYWLLAAAPEANMPNSGYNLNAPSCAAVSYVVEKDGSTSHVKLEKVAPDGDLGKVAVNVVTAMQFAAAKQNQGKTPVSTFVVIPFNLPDATSPNAAERTERARVLAACRLDSFDPSAKETVVPVR
jgi:hypothetical protein